MFMTSNVIKTLVKARGGRARWKWAKKVESGGMGYLFNSVNNKRKI